MYKRNASLPTVNFGIRIQNDKIENYIPKTSFVQKYNYTKCGFVFYFCRSRC